MTPIEKHLLETLKAYLNDTPPSEFDSDILQEALNLAIKHNIANFYYYGLLKSGNEKIANKYHLVAMMQTAQQDIEYGILKKALIDAKIRFMPFKGAAIRKIYKNPDARSMADIDIFVDEESLEKIKPIMAKLGYTPEHSTDMHDSYIKKPTLNIEFHKDFISEETDFNFKLRDKFSPFDEGVCSENGYEYNLSAENEYIYMIVHSARHFHGSGMGIKMVIDAYQYNRFYKNLDKSYIKSRLEDLKLDKFEKRLVSLANYWFSEETADDIDILFGEWILKSGAFGTSSQREIHEVVTHSADFDTAKRKKGVSMLFPSAKYLSNYYLWLEKYPFLLPFAWILRFFRIIFKEKGVSKRFSDKISVSEKGAKELSKLYEELGFYK